MAMIRAGIGANPLGVAAKTLMWEDFFLILQPLLDLMSGIASA
jgi:hypothetical protein